LAPFCPYRPTLKQVNITDWPILRQFDTT